MESQEIKMSTRKVFKIFSFKIPFIIFLCLITVSTGLNPLQRNQRQTITGGLPTIGMTNTGTSFYPNYNNQNPNNLYQPQLSISPDNVGLGKGNVGSSWYDRNLYGGQGVTRGYGVEGPRGYGSRGYENFGQTWRGFGAGKSPYGARPHQQSQHGIKY